MPVSIVVGGQFGSEGKGKIALEVARRSREPVTAVRVGGSNSGHTAFDSQGRRRVLRQIPAAAIDGARIVLPAASYIDAEVLLEEIDLLGLGPDRLTIDRRAKLICRTHRAWENDAGLCAAIGSTGSGTGGAVMANVARSTDALDLPSPRVDIVPELASFIGSADEVLTSRLARRERVVVEGTQGFGLSLNFGDWPFVTSRDTTAAAFATEAGTPVTEVDDVTMVIRCHPIRVGGRSGELPNEIDWSTITRDSGSDRELSERTTVTGKIRRVGEFDSDIVRRAIAANGPTRIVLNHLDYVDWTVRSGELSDEALRFVSDLERSIGRRVDWIGTDERTVVDRPATDNVHFLATS
ncbi:adenylosuccinate synthetase [Erythrobacter sp. LQ02-29]|uniref:adenylosuccinate synthetase n=1 Tax=Erythrobacter sp. LQ02-29 TaxID=2920384 RepID=UPI001F4D80A4|nr:adenylosuccinate synthetase [Erythrobacter sp. LQ02-29]MCP9221915.1 adenylosuccinate synthetase [Erythrobacter sp. LQ02-29]